MRREDAYFGALGVAVAVTGVLAVVRGVGIDVPALEAIAHLLAVSGTFLVWRGVILATAGALFVSGATGGLADRENQATVVLASVMVWIVAGTDLLSRLLGAIPGGSDVWIAAPTEIVAALGPPYGPALLFAPLALLALKYRRSPDGDQQ